MFESLLLPRSHRTILPWRKSLGRHRLNGWQPDQWVLAPSTNDVISSATLTTKEDKRRMIWTNSLFLTFFFALCIP